MKIWHLKSETRLFWAGVAFIGLVGAILRLLSYRFELPYIAHPDEPVYYLWAQARRGLLDFSYVNDYLPPLYAWTVVFVLTVLDWAGVEGISTSMGYLRLLSVGMNLATLVFIALSARLMAGNIAGWVAGLGWAVAPLVVENGVYALPDVMVYLLVSAAIWAALVAWFDPARDYWSVISVGVGLLAILAKYPVLPALAPGGLVALGYLKTRRKRAMGFIAAQGVMVSAVAFWLLAFYHVLELKGEGEVARESGLSNFIEPDRVLNNIRHAVVPLGEAAFVAMLLAAAAAYLWAKRQHLKTIPLLPVGMVTVVLVTIPWLASTYSEVSPAYRMRDVLPATTAACILLGCAAAQVSYIVKHKPMRVLMAAGLAALVFLPLWNDSWALAQERHKDSTHVVLRQWIDINLDPGNYLVYRENHKTFNPYWGGNEGRYWIDTWEINDITKHTVAEWRDDLGMAYVLLPIAEQQRLESTPEGRDYLSQMLLLRDLADHSRWAGPEIMVYRTWRIEYELAALFGDRVWLRGFDQSAEEVKAGESVTFRFYWQASAPPPLNYSLFIHLVPEDSFDVKSQTDGNPGMPERLTQTWDDPTETIISQPFTLSIPPDLAPGSYRVLIGLYDFTTGIRLTISQTDRNREHDTFYLTTITVIGN